MVINMTNAFLQSLEDDAPLMQRDALTPQQLRAAAEFDIKSGILDAKDFPRDLEEGVMLRNFTDAYGAVLRAIQASTRGLLGQIIANTPSIPAYENDPIVLIQSTIRFMPITQSAAVADVETNAAHANLRAILSDIKNALTRLGGGLPSNLSPDLQQITRLSQELEVATDRDVIEQLFDLKKPRATNLAVKTNWMAGESPTRTVNSLLTVAAATQYRRYAQCWMLVLYSHELAVEAAKAFFDIGGTIPEIRAALGGADPLEYFERDLSASHDAIRNALSDVLTDISGRAVDPANAAQIANFANQVSAQVVSPRRRTRAQREEMAHYALAIAGMINTASDAFAVRIT